MSRSNKKLQHPCERWFKWEGGEEKGYFSWYDKETEKTHAVDMPFTFLVLDQLNTVTGYDSDAKSGFYSNEVRNTTTDILTVRSKGGVEAEGVWKEVKGVNKSFDFTKSVYIAFYDDSEKLVIGNIKFKGSGLSGLTDDAIKANLEEAKVNRKVEAKTKKVDEKTLPLDAYTPAHLKSIGWINFSNSRNDLDEIAVVWTGVIEDSNGNTKFWRPIFAPKTNISEETNQAAIELDKELQIYLKDYFATQRELASESDNVDDYIAERDAIIGETTDIDQAHGGEWNPTDADAPDAIDEEIGW